MTLILVSWYPTNVATAKSILKYNLAVAYAYRGELDKSGEILKQVLQKTFIHLKTYKYKNL